MSKNINITELFRRDYNEYDYSKLELQLNGSNINTSIVNALRRTAMLNIPIYGICTKSIDIEENTSIFDNDYMRMRLSQIPIFNITNEIIFLPNEYWKDVDYSNRREKFSEDTLDLELYINESNDTNSNINIYSDSITYMLNGIEVDDLLQNIEPILVIQLRPGEVFKTKIDVVLGMGERDILWSSVSNLYYDEIEENDFKMILESQGQLHEYDILVRSCLVIKKKLEDIKTKINNSFNEEEYKDNEIIKIILTNEDHTIGNLINEGLQDSNDIDFCGASKPDLLIKEIILKLLCNNKNPMMIFNKVITKYVNIFDEIESNLRKLGKRYIKI